MKINVGYRDRIIRMLLVAFIVGLFFNEMITGMNALFLSLVAIIFFFTATLGVCPLYTLLKINTLTKTKE